MFVLYHTTNKKTHNKIIDYLCTSKTARKIIEFHKTSPVKIHIVQVEFHGKLSFANDYGFQDGKHIIYYNPKSGYEGPSGILSPALAHAHELVHAFLHITKHKITTSIHNKEEDFVVKNYENKISRELKEPIRLNYRAFKKVMVNSPFHPLKVTKRWH